MQHEQQLCGYMIHTCVYCELSFTDNDGRCYINNVPMHTVTY